MNVELSAKTHVGRVRSGNEDNFLLLDAMEAKDADNPGWI